MEARELENKLDEVLGESEDNRYDEWWERYTGSNALYHMLAEVAYEVNAEIPAKVVSDGVVAVKGLGTFTKVEVYDDDFDKYESSSQTNLVFEFEGNYYRVSGRLDSHYGGVFDGRLEKVQPREKTITVWEEA